MAQTPAQTRAIHDHDANLVVVAGAGSGKTYVLVERYLALLERNPSWPLSSLVAITFTQKAAGEMRDRVRAYMQTRADEGGADGEIDTIGDQWSRRLAAMDSARIDTIHGLCTAILRGNAAEAGVDPGFEVLDEIDALALLDDTLDDVFRQLSSDDVFRLLAADDPALELFAEYGERVVREALKGLIHTEFEPLSDDILTEWLAQWVDEGHALAEAYFQQVCALERFAPVGTDVLSQGWEVCCALIDWLTGQTERRKLFEYIDAIEQIAGLKLPGVPAKAWGEDGAAAKAAFKTIRDGAKAALAAIGEPPGAADERAAHLLPLWASLVNRVRAAYRTAKDERGALDFDDLETLTRDLLRHHEDVRARYTHEFNHLLVDEFQDTNAAQWDIIRALAAPEHDGRLFVVGDPKQSIYGFRGADVSVFERVRREVGQQVDLDRSFRTHRGLVNCLNSVFERLLLRDPLSPVAAYQVEFAAMEAERLDAPCGDAALELLLLDAGKLPQDAGDQAPRRWEARAVARRIKQLVTEGRPIFDKKLQITRAMGYGDAALLFQAMTHVTLYEAALKAEGIPYLTVAGKGYYDRQEVWDLLNLLRALYNPADNLALAAALRSPLFSLSDDALLALRLVKGGSLTLWAALDQAESAPGSAPGSIGVGVPADEAEALTFARETLTDLRKKAGRVTVAELLRRALEATGYLAVLAGLPDGKRRRGNVEKLIDKAETSGRLTLSAFTQYLTELSASEIREGEASLENEGAVQLMSVHGSKGLEFPLVALVDAQHERGGGFEGVVKGASCKVYDEASDRFVETYAYRRAAQLERGREEAERKRLLYVAATRAQDHLLVSGQVKVSEKDGTVTAKGWLGQLIGALELGEVAPEVTQTVAYDWGEARIDFPEWSEGDEAAPDVAADWDQPLAGEKPALLGDLRTRVPLRSLTASQLADLGSAMQGGKDAPYFAERWRRSAYHEAPARIEQVVRAAPKNVGEIVHRALRWPLPEDRAALETTLRRFAWEEGIVDETENREAVKKAYYLLTQVRESDMFQAVERARAVYRQVPFVYGSAGQARSVHGVIDLLAHGADGQWRVVDFKTNWLRGAVTEAALAQDARRYHVQMAIYAAAVRELVGDAPLVLIHYIRYARTITIAQTDWQVALARLDDDLELSGGDG